MVVQMDRDAIERMLIVTVLHEEQKDTAVVCDAGAVGEEQSVVSLKEISRRERRAHAARLLCCQPSHGPTSSTYTATHGQPHADASIKPVKTA